MTIKGISGCADGEAEATGLVRWPSARQLGPEGVAVGLTRSVSSERGWGGETEWS